MNFAQYCRTEAHEQSLREIVRVRRRRRTLNILSSVFTLLGGLFMAFGNVFNLFDDEAILTPIGYLGIAAVVISLIALIIQIAAGSNSEQIGVILEDSFREGFLLYNEDIPKERWKAFVKNDALELNIGLKQSETAGQLFADELILTGNGERLELDISAWQGMLKIQDMLGLVFCGLIPELEELPSNGRKAPLIYARVTFTLNNVPVRKGLRIEKTRLDLRDMLLIKKGKWTLTHGDMARAAVKRARKQHEKTVNTRGQA